MKKKLAVIESGLMQYYLQDFLNLCRESEIQADLVVFEEKPEYTNLVNRTIKILEDEKLSIEEKIRKNIKIADYDYVICDCLYLSFACNILHSSSTAERMAIAKNFIYRKILQLGHLKKILAEKKLFKNCPKMIAVSNYSKRDYVKNYAIHPDNVIVAHPGTNSLTQDILPTAKSENKKPFVIGTVTCGFTTKGGYNLLGALYILKKKYSNKEIRVKFINPNFSKQWFLNLVLKISGLDKYVEMLPYQENINLFFNSLDCFVCASNRETFGRIVTEAMLCKKVVVLGSNVGATDIIEEGKNGFVYDASSYKNLAQKLDEIILREGSFRDIENAARKTALKLTWANFAKEILVGLYPDLVFMSGRA